MSEAPDELGELIARARQDGPAPERLAAVRARLEARLGPLDAPPSPPSPAVSAKVALGIVGVAAVIAIGVWLGTRGDDRSTTRLELDAPALRPAPPSAPAGDPAPAPPIVEEPVVEEGRTDEPGTEERQPSPVATGDEDATRVERSARRVAHEPGPVAPELSAEDPASMLREEIALLDRALRARESGDPARAVAALEEHRARFPSGRLQPERDRLLAELATSGAPTTP